MSSSPTGFIPYDTQAVKYVTSIPSNPDSSIVYMLWDGIDASKAVRYEFSDGELRRDNIVETKNVILMSSTNGDATDWLLASPYSERFGVLLTGISATVSLTGSGDGVTVAAGYAATITMDTAGSTFITPPMNFDYKFIKFTVMSLGAASSIEVSRGV